MGRLGCIWRPPWPKRAAARPRKTRGNVQLPVSDRAWDAMAKGTDQESGRTDHAKGTKAARAKR